MESFIGALVIADRAGLGASLHRVRLFLDEFPFSRYFILHPHHIPKKPCRLNQHPFALLNVVEEERVCMPTIVSCLDSDAFRPLFLGKGMVYDTLTACGRSLT